MDLNAIIRGLQTIIMVLKGIRKREFSNKVKLSGQTAAWK
jgi:hypothetical protein